VSISITEPTEWMSVVNPRITEIKERIGLLDKEHKWELAKKMVNPYELVYTHDDERLPPSLSMEHPLSRSYYKMIEILHVLQFWKSQGRQIRTAHVAEGPGGFIQAVLQQADVAKKTVAQALAMTLRPNNPHVPGWKKATAFLHRYKQVRIHYGADGTGDLYRPENQLSFVQQCAPASVQLFTADGGFDFSIDYLHQEQKVYHLLVCSATIGIQVCKPGASFVLKLFDCASEHTRLLILLLGRLFQEWTLYKPAMTRPCNSERYFLGRGFRGCSPEVLDLFLKVQAASASGTYCSLSAESWTPAEHAFLETHMDHSIESQIRSIELAIQLSQSPADWFQKWYPNCLHKSVLWCEAFRVMAVPGPMHKAAARARFPTLLV
jgi:23S rRNA U2552 (ribose-2'-O)-methylase RlmE/FtsJ